MREWLLACYRQVLVCDAIDIARHPHRPAPAAARSVETTFNTARNLYAYKYNATRRRAHGASRFMLVLYRPGDEHCTGTPVVLVCVMLLSYATMYVRVYAHSAFWFLLLAARDASGRRQYTDVCMISARHGPLTPLRCGRLERDRRPQE